MVQIRDAIASDRLSLLTLYGIFVDDHERFVNGDGDSFLQVLEDKRTHILVAELNSDLIGFITYSKRNVVRYPKPIVEVEELFILKEYRRRGIATQLIDRVVAFGREHNCQYVFVASGTEHLSAHTMYAKYGFDEYGKHFRLRLEHDTI